MPRERLCKICRGWHDVEAWPDNCRQVQWEQPSDLPAPMVLQDGMKPVQSMTNGLWYDSKSAIRKEYRRAGVVEVGNDVPTKKPTIDKAAEKKKRQATIGKAFSRAGLGA